MLIFFGIATGGAVGIVVVLLMLTIREAAHLAIEATQPPDDDGGTDND